MMHYDRHCNPSATFSCLLNKHRPFPSLPSSTLPTCVSGLIDVATLLECSVLVASVVRMCQVSFSAAQIACATNTQWFASFPTLRTVPSFVMLLYLMPARTLGCWLLGFAAAGAEDSVGCLLEDALCSGCRVVEINFSKAA